MRTGFKIFPIATESPREMEFFGSGNTLYYCTYTWI